MGIFQIDTDYKKEAGYSGIIFPHPASLMLLYKLCVSSDIKCPLRQFL